MASGRFSSIRNRNDLLGSNQVRRVRQRRPDLIGGYAIVGRDLLDTVSGGHGSCQYLDGHARTPNHRPSALHAGLGLDVRLPLHASPPSQITFRTLESVTPPVNAARFPRLEGSPRVLVFASLAARAVLPTGRPFSFPGMLLARLFALSIGVFSGLYPALTVSRMKPVDALAGN